MRDDNQDDSSEAGRFGWLRDIWQEAERWPLAGTARRAGQRVEDRALAELKTRLAAHEAPDDLAADGAPSERHQSAPEMLLADLLARERSVDPDRARRDLYRRILVQLVPDQIAILRILAKREIGTLCHIGASRLPAGPVTSLALENASSLGQEAGVLLREFTPYYMTQLLRLGLVRTGAADTRLNADYELLLADPNVRAVMDEVRTQQGAYPRVLRHSVRLSVLGAGLWRDCYPAAQALDARRMRY